MGGFLGGNGTTQEQQQQLEQSQNFTIGSFLASLITAFVVFGVQFLAFLLINAKLPRIYRPRTYLVPEKERTKPPPAGLWQWILPVFHTSNSEFIQKCGLDAYFFLRYLRMLLKIFIPAAFLIMPILIPLNAVGGKGTEFSGEVRLQTGRRDPTWTNVTGLNELSWSNIRPTAVHRYWAHLILAVCLVIYCCYTFFDELRGYIRLRQAYLTSPQHRLRASATTVLVSTIPRKWCSAEALEGLFDVFPGGIRNIWINRDFDELQEKVEKRDKLAKKLEKAQTELIRKCQEVYDQRRLKEEKKQGHKKTAEELKSERKMVTEKAIEEAQQPGLSVGDPHQVRHTLREQLDASSSNRSGLNSSGASSYLSAPTPKNGQNGQNGQNGLKETPAQRDADQDAIEVAAGDQLARGFRPEDLHHDAAYVVAAQANANGRTPTGLRTPGAVTTERDRKAAGGPELAQNTTPEKSSKRGGHFWTSKKSPLDLPSPTPKTVEDDEFPLRLAPQTPARLSTTPSKFSEPEKSDAGNFADKASDKGSEEAEYPSAVDETYDSINDGDPMWKKYIKAKDRDTMRLPIYGIEALGFLPFVGKKVDTIEYCRETVAKLNLEIEQDQKHPEKYPLMNSAFIQFNHQVAAHMACQSVAHHVPNQMAPRMVEISPNDVIWDNMSIKWWERYIRTFGIIAIVVGLIISYAVPVAFTGLLANISYLSQSATWLHWLNKIPKALINPIQGVLPQAILAILLAVLPIILRFLSRLQGFPTGMGVELAVQDYYFVFLFIQVFLVVTLSSGIWNTLGDITKTPQNIPSVLATNLPKASNYFFSYLLLQALSTSAGTLLQIGGLAVWFLIAPILDSTARQKWSRQIKLPDMQWGTFFPVYTNLAVIGLVYSIVSPLILIFNIITFVLFWFVYRYNTLYVTKFRFDTGGLLFPKAINQLFTGLYVMELCLVGLFFLVRGIDEDGNAVGVPCKVQAVIMIVVIFLTAGYQILLNRAFGPLFQYLPITLEDEAVARDAEYARAQEKRFNLAPEEKDGDDINEVLAAREARDEAADEAAEAFELQQIADRRSHPHSHLLDPRNVTAVLPDSLRPAPGSWADRGRRRSSAWVNDGVSHADHAEHEAERKRKAEARRKHIEESNRARQLLHDYSLRPPTERADEEAAAAIANGNPPDDVIHPAGAGNPIANALFADINDEIEDLAPEERDRLVRRAFQHAALRSRRPAVWVPADGGCGVAADEVRRCGRKCGRWLWVSCEGAGLDGKARVVYARNPPDFSEVDLIEL